MQSHCLIHTGEKPFICQICGNKYTRVARLKIHQRTHVIKLVKQTGEKPFTCNHPDCGKTFADKVNLTTHIRTHTGERPFHCSYENCGKSFTTSGHLKDHERRHFNDRPFECVVCKTKFFRKTTLKTHMRLHTGDRPFVCNFKECHKSFTDKGNLNSHIKKHYKADFA